MNFAEATKLYEQERGFDALRPIFYSTGSYELYLRQFVLSQKSSTFEGRLLHYVQMELRMKNDDTRRTAHLAIATLHPIWQPDVDGNNAVFYHDAPDWGGEAEA